MVEVALAGPYLEVAAVAVEVPQLYRMSLRSPLDKSNQGDQEVVEVAVVSAHPSQAEGVAVVLRGGSQAHRLAMSESRQQTTDME